MIWDIAYQDLEYNNEFVFSEYTSYNDVFMR